MQMIHINERGVHENVMFFVFPSYVIATGECSNDSLLTEQVNIL